MTNATMPRRHACRPTRVGLTSAIDAAANAATATGGVAGGDGLADGVGGVSSVLGAVGRDGKIAVGERGRLDPLGEGGVVVPADGGGVDQRGEGAEGEGEAREEFHGSVIRSRVIFPAKSNLEGLDGGISSSGRGG